MTLEDKVAIVTGANHGIGAAVARRLASDGAAVFVTYLRLPDARGDDPGTPATYGRQRAVSGDEVADAILRDGGRAAAWECDLAEPSAVAELFDRATDALGPVDVLVNNGWHWEADTFKPASADRFGRVLRTVDADTVDAHFALVRAAASSIAELARRSAERGAGWGRVVSLTSEGRDGFPEEVSYGASKAALESYTFSAAAELGPLGITANVVYPPVTDTGWVTEEVRAAVSDHGLRVADPSDVAEVVAWLCSDAARNVTGQRIKMS